GLKTGFRNWVKNLDPRGKDRYWFTGAAVGIAESAAFIWLPIPGKGWVKAGISLATAQGIYAITKVAYGRKESQVRRRYQGEELIQRMIELESGYKLATGRVRNFYLGVSAGATYVSATGLLIESARSIAHELSLSVNFKEVADKIQADLQAKINAQAVPPTPEPPTPAPGSITPSPEPQTPDVAAAEVVAPTVPTESMPATPPSAQESFGEARPEVGLTPEGLLGQLPVDMVKEVDIPADSTVSNILVNNGYAITWTPADADVWVSHIAVNHPMLHAFWDQMVAAGHATGEFPIADLDELKELLEQAKSEDIGIASAAQRKLIAALHWIPAGGKFKVLTPEGVASMLRMLR
ncbi:MAG: hypothetical protein Q8R11_02335, partial [bacterium]|nr:hypothetical protein [bacterium]